MSVPDAAIRCGWIRRLVRDDWVELTAFGGCELVVGDLQKKGLIIAREALTENRPKLHRPHYEIEARP